MKFEHILGVEIDEPFYVIRKSSMQKIKEEIARLKSKIENLEESRDYYADMLNIYMGGND